MKNKYNLWIAFLMVLLALCIWLLAGCERKPEKPPHRFEVWTNQYGDTMIIDESGKREWKNGK